MPRGGPEERRKGRGRPDRPAPQAGGHLHGLQSCCQGEAEAFAGEQDCEASGAAVSDSIAKVREGRGGEGRGGEGRGGEEGEGRRRKEGEGRRRREAEGRGGEEREGVGREGEGGEGRGRE